MKKSKKRKTKKVKVKEKKTSKKLAVQNERAGLQ